jgi:hypothetical protein
MKDCIGFSIPKLAVGIVIESDVPESCWMEYQGNAL